MSVKTRRFALAGAAVIAIAGLAACFTPADTPMSKMSFFITSVGSGKGGDLGGLAGADAHCATLAQAAGAPSGKTWRAYLSAAPMGGQPAVNARDRIGSGPWFNAAGVQVAANLADLHSENAKTGKEGSLSEKGLPVNGRGDTPNQHDIMTGSDAEGRLAAVPPPAANAAAGAVQPTNMTCNNWTASVGGRTMVGHHDRQGGGANPTSWNSAHASRSCAQTDLVATGGNGYYYCFAAN